MEIRYYAMIGADIVGMTAMPEASLAREQEMCMLGISVVTNYAAGISTQKLTTTEAIENMRNANNKVKQLLEELMPRI
jgi:5'-methylthioadenosine phosphorylase